MLFKKFNRNEVLFKIFILVLMRHSHADLQDYYIRNISEIFLKATSEQHNISNFTKDYNTILDIVHGGFKRLNQWMNFYESVSFMLKDCFNPYSSNTLNCSVKINFVKVFSCWKVYHLRSDNISCSFPKNIFVYVLGKRKNLLKFSLYSTNPIHRVYFLKKDSSYMVELENSETRLHSIYFIHNFTTLAIKTDDFHIVPSDNPFLIKVEFEGIYSFLPKIIYPSFITLEKCNYQHPFVEASFEIDSFSLKAPDLKISMVQNDALLISIRKDRTLKVGFKVKALKRACFKMEQSYLVKHSCTSCFQTRTSNFSERSKFLLPYISALPIIINETFFPIIYLRNASTLNPDLIKTIEMENISVKLSICFLTKLFLYTFYLLK